MSSQRTTRIIFWVGIALLIAAIAVFIIKKSQGGSNAAPAAKSSSGSVLSQSEFQKQSEKAQALDTNKKWAQLPASARLAVRTFIVDGAGERNLASAWRYAGPEIRQGFTYKQWVHGNQLPFQVFPQMNFKLPISYTLTSWNGHELLADVGVASTYKTGRGGYTFTIGAAKAGQGSKAHWLVNYFLAKYTPPVRADPSQNFGG